MINKKSQFLKKLKEATAIDETDLKDAYDFHGDLQR
jgi:hypothetical protein